MQVKFCWSKHALTVTTQRLWGLSAYLHSQQWRQADRLKIAPLELFCSWLPWVEAKLSCILK